MAPSQWGEVMADEEPGAAIVTAEETSKGSAGHSREGRATLTFTITGIFILIVWALYGGLLLMDSPTFSTVYLIGPLIAAAALLAAAFGLHRRRPWAESVVTPMLFVLVISGIVTFVLTLVSGGLDIPIASILGVWALLAPSRAETGERTPGGLVLLGALVLSAVWPFVIGALLRG